MLYFIELIKLKITSKAITEYKLTLVVSAYIGLLLNAPIFYRKFMAQPDINLATFISDIIAAFFVCAFLVHLASLLGKVIYKAVVIGYLLASSVAAFYMWFFNVVIGYGIIQAILGTQASLSLESTDYRLPVFLIVFGILPSLLVMFITLKPAKSFALGAAQRIVFLLFLFILLKGVNVIYEGTRKELVNGQRQANPIGVAAHSYLPTNWIASTVLAAGSYIINKKLQEEWIDPFDKFNFFRKSSSDDVYLIFVIGESARYNNMALMGYSRNTTPEMLKQKNLLGFKGKSCNTVTKASLACMFVREGGVVDKENPEQQLVYENNVFHVLKKLGFTIDLFAMQSEAGFYTTINADMFKLREEVAAEASLFDRPAIDDMLLVDQAFQSIDSHPKGKHVVILHQKGQHFLYSSRYPASFAKYKPECKSLSCSLEELINAYDNSILYTDHFLTSLIRGLNNKKVLMVYASDHGESISDGEHFHGSPKPVAPREQRQVPIILWASDMFLGDPVLSKGFNQARKRLEKNQLLRHEELFESILGCLGYGSNNGGIRPKNNWCS